MIWREVHVVLEVKLFDNNSHCHPIKALRKLLDWHASDSPSLRVTTISVALLGLKGNVENGRKITFSEGKIVSFVMYSAIGKFSFLFFTPTTIRPNLS